MAEVDRRTFLKVAGSGAVTAAVAGCTSQQPADGGDETTQEDGGTTTDDTTSSGGGDENEMVYMAVDALSSIDPAKPGGATDYSIILNLYDTFLYIGGGEDFKTVGNLATDWTTENDSQTWVFTLREDVTFHDGTPLTAEDVVYSMKRALRLKAGPTFLWLDVIEPENISARGEYEVVFDLNYPFGPFFASLAQFFVANSSVAKENEEDGSYGEHGDYAQDYLGNTPAGSGPYTLESWEQSSQLVMDAYPDYWGGWEENQFDTARVKIVGEDSTAKILMKQGDADLSSKFLATEIYEEMSTYDNVEILKSPQLFTWMFHMFTQKPPLDDVNVRKAITYAFDYEPVVTEIFAGGDVAQGPVPIKMPGHNDDIPAYSQDLDTAKAALDDAEYSLAEINDIEIEVMYTSVLAWERPISLLLQSALKKIGIENVTLADTEWATMLDRVTSKESTPHFTQVGNTAKMLSPDSYTFGMYHSSSWGKINASSWWTTDELEGTLEDARRTASQAERFAKYKEAQQLIVDGYPSLYLANPPYRAARNTNLGGWSYKGLLSYDHRFYDMHRIGDGRAK